MKLVPPHLFTESKHYMEQSSRLLQQQCEAVQLGGDIDGVKENDRLGNSVSISADGTTVAAGAPNQDGISVGYLRVYAYDNGWVQLGDEIGGTAPNDLFGWSVSLSADGRTVASGAPGDTADGTESGPVRVFTYDTGTGWTQLGGGIVGAAVDDEFGYSITLSDDGRTLAIGAPLNDGNAEDGGHVRVYTYDDGLGWTQLGDDLVGEAAGDEFGHSVSLSADGRTVAAGAPLSDGNGVDSGHVQVYNYDAGTGWIQVGDYIIGEAGDDRSGWSIALSADGATVAIGAWANDGSGTDSGHVRVHTFNEGTGWSQLGDDIDGEAADDRSGQSISLSADARFLAIGAPNNDGNGRDGGHVRIYSYSSANGWAQLGGDIDSEGPFELSGWSVSLSDDSTSVAVGAPINSASATGSGSVRVFSLEDCLENPTAAPATTLSPAKAPSFSDGGISTGAIIGSALGCVLFFTLVGLIVLLRWKSSRKENDNQNDSSILAVATPVQDDDTLPSDAVAYVPTYKDSGRSVLHERQPIVMADALPTD